MEIREKIGSSSQSSRNSGEVPKATFGDFLEVIPAFDPEKNQSVEHL